MVKRDFLLASFNKLALNTIGGARGFQNIHSALHIAELHVKEITAFYTTYLFLLNNSSLQVGE